MILKRSAPEYYFRFIDPKITPETTIDDVITMIRNNFEGNEHKQFIFQKQGYTTLKEVIFQSPTKSISQNLDNIIDQLGDLRLGIKPAFRNKDNLHAKLFESRRGIPE